MVKPAPVARPAGERATLQTSAIEQALAPYLGDRDLGSNVLAAVAPLRGGGFAYESSSSGEAVAIPASTTKIVTSTVALSLLGGGHVFRTRTVLDRSAGAEPRLVLVGGGDPFLAATPELPDSDATFEARPADLSTLAVRTAKTLRAKGVRSVRLGYDTSLFSGPTGHPSWRGYPRLDVDPYIAGDVISPISPLWLDEGRSPSGSGREDDPAATTATVFAAELADQGIRVTGQDGSVVAPGKARGVAAVASPPLAQIVQRILEVSDNEGAEILLRHVGIAAVGEGSFEGGQRGVRRTLLAHDIPFAGSVLYDGSGLSRDNRMSPQVLVDVLRWAATDRDQELRAIVSSLPVAGWTGSLDDRMDQGAAAGRGRVRAKTGTLTRVSSLAGIAVDLDGTVMVFALMADAIPKNRDGYAQLAEDNAAAALGACHCG